MLFLDKKFFTLISLLAKMQKITDLYGGKNKYSKDAFCLNLMGMVYEGLKEYNNAGNMIYIIKVKNNEDGSYIVKIGESRKGITERYNECKTKHKNIK